MTRRWTAKTFQDCAANAEKGVEEGGAGGGRSITITTNVKYLKKPKPENRLKGSLNIYISSLLPLPFLRSYFLKNQITQIPEQEKLMVQPNNIMEITHDFEGERKPFYNSGSEDWRAVWGGNVWHKFQHFAVLVK